MSAVPTQAHRNMAIATSLGEGAVMLENFAYQEELGRPFRLTAHVTTLKPNDIKIEDTIGTAATIRMSRKDKVERYFNGIVVRIVQNARVKEKPEFELTIVPKVWLLTHNADCRIFQKKTIPEIIKEVFKLRGIDDALKDELKGSFQKHDYTVQYRESDFNFISRLMEAEGIYYYFKHDNGKHEMVLCNDPSCHTALDGYASLPFMPPTSAMVPDHVDDWRSEAEIQTKTVTLHAFDFKAPNTRPKHTQNLDYKFVWPYEVFDYPAEFHLPDEARHYTKLRAEELASGAKFYFARTDCRGVTAGGKFELTDPSSQLRADQAREYMVTGVSLQGSVSDYQIGQNGGGEEFSCTFRCIDAKRVFRPARTTPKPVITGLQTATVVGPAGEEIHTDQYGRVRVQFHWDRYGKADENSSCWIRVSQAWAGAQWGAFYLPRIGHEVIVEFLEGDPDRPLVTGSVYNQANKPPYALPDNKTRSTLKSLSSKEGGGFNEIRFEDKKGSEQIFIHAQKDQDVRIEETSREFIGKERHLIVKDKAVESFEANKHLSVKESVFIKITGGVNELIHADQKQKIDGKSHLIVGGGRAVKVTGKDGLEVTDHLAIKAGKISIKSDGDVHAKSGGVFAIDGASEVHVKGAKVIIEGSTQVSLKVGGNFIDIGPAGVSITGTMINLNSGGAAGSGSGCSPADPESPAEPEPPEAPAEADNDAAGSNTQGATSSASAATANSTQLVQGPPRPAGSSQPQAALTWVGIELKDENGNPVPGEKYKVKLPDGSISEGTLDDEGKARIDGVEPGSVEIAFPNISGNEWKKA